MAPDKAGTACPPWCTVHHGDLRGEEDLVHLGNELIVRQTVLRLCFTVDVTTGEVDGPYVLVGGPELAMDFTLHEAEVLIAALTQLVDQGAQLIPAEA